MASLQGAQFLLDPAVLMPDNADERGDRPKHCRQNARAICARMTSTLVAELQRSRNLPTAGDVDERRECTGVRYLVLQAYAEYEATATEAAS